MDTRVTIVTAAVFFIFFILLWLLRIVVKYQRNNFRHSLEKQQIQAEFSQTLLQSELEIKEQTLQQMARELHDNIGQVASLIKINLHTLNVGDNSSAVQKVEDTKELVRQLILDVKSLSISLNSERVSKLGIVTALENEVERLNKTGLFNATLDQVGVAPTLEDNTTVILYRMAQEIINNIVKHSGAKHVVISLNTTKTFFILAFRDDGDGYDVSRAMTGGGSGLMNLHSRAKLIQAKVTFDSSPGNGSNTSIELPIMNDVT
jgi:signal transduction histidine kinase